MASFHKTVTVAKQTNDIRIGVTAVHNIRTDLIGPEINLFSYLVPNLVQDNFLLKL